MKYGRTASIFSELRLMTECCLIAFLLCFFSAGAGAVSVMVDEPVFQQEAVDYVLMLEMDEVLPVNGRVQPCLSRVGLRTFVPVPVTEISSFDEVSPATWTSEDICAGEPLHWHIRRILRNSLVVRAAPEK